MTLKNGSTSRKRAPSPPGGRARRGSDSRAARSRPLKRKRVGFDTVRKLALALPKVAEGSSYGTPALRVAGKFLARLWEDGETLVVRIDDDTRDALIQADPKTFFITDHYRGYPALLVRLSSVHPVALRRLLEESWRFAAPKRLLAAQDRLKVL